MSIDDDEDIWRPPVPELARFGFHHGWLCLNPTFLNLGRPVLIVDHRLVPAAGLGLTPITARPPASVPARQARATLQHTTLALWTGPTLLGLHDCPRAWTARAADAHELVVIAGDTHLIDLGWSWLWDGSIGRLTLDQPHPAAHVPTRRPPGDAGQPAAPSTMG